jgi:hypothetical protein
MAKISRPMVRIHNSETNEVIAVSINEALANIIERLERIEVAVGMIAS